VHDRSLLESATQWLIRESPRVGRWVGYGAAILVTAPLLYHRLRGSPAYLGLFEDDYFYYAIVADKLASLGKLTYDSTTLTNGFHPLWFLVVLALRLVAGGFGTGYYVALSVVFVAAMMATFELSGRLARELGASPPMAVAAALVPSVTTYGVMSSGMETALDVPLLLWLLCEIARGAALTPRRATKLGFIASLAVLARLDVSLLVAFVIVGWLVLARPTLSRVLRIGVPFCAGGAAVPLYAAVNVLAFGSLLPVSALAKQLIKRPGINLRYLLGIALESQYGRGAGLLLGLGAVAVLLAWKGSARGRVRPQALFAAAVSLAFAGTFYFINALSGWIYFGWYAYPLAPAILVSLTLVGHLAASRISTVVRARATALAVAAAASLGALQAAVYFAIHAPWWSVDDNGLLAMSIDLAERVRDRKGVYGMGAIGGFASYLVGQPFVQLEGLVADRAMVDHIRNEDDLGAVLAAYHVDYLVVSFNRMGVERHDGCYVVTEPHVEWAGKRAAKMRGEICDEPVVHFPTRLHENPWSQFSRLDTYVFDVRNARWRSPSATSAADPVLSWR
jgi:hypothetical protein